MANLGINDHYKKVTGITIDVQGLINACSSDDEKKALYDKLQWNIGLLVSCGNGCHEGKFLADGVTKASLLSDLYSLLVENDGISVEGVDQLKDLLENTFAGWKVIKHTIVHQKYDIPRENCIANLETDVVTYVVRKDK